MGSLSIIFITLFLKSSLRLFSADICSSNLCCSIIKSTPFHFTIDNKEPVTSYLLDTSVNILSLNLLQKSSFLCISSKVELLKFDTIS